MEQREQPADIMRREIEDEMERIWQASGAGKRGPLKDEPPHAQERIKEQATTNVKNKYNSRMNRALNS